VRIHRPIRLEESAHPFERLRASLVGRKFHRVVQADKAAPALHLRFSLGKVISLEQEMPATAIGVEEDRIRLRKLLLRRPLRIQVHLRRDIRSTLVQALREELHARVVLMLSRTVRRLTRQQQDEWLAVRSLRRGERCRGQQSRSRLHEESERTSPGGGVRSQARRNGNLR
jgi:hypothetical protein